MPSVEFSSDTKEKELIYTAYTSISIPIIFVDLPIRVCAGAYLQEHFLSEDSDYPTRHLLCFRTCLLNDRAYDHVHDCGRAHVAFLVRLFPLLCTLLVISQEDASRRLL